MKAIKEFLKPTWWKISIVVVIIILLWFCIDWYGKYGPHKAIDARIQVDLVEIRNVAFKVFEEKGNYEDVNCKDNNDIKILCEHIKELNGSNPIIHNSNEKYCAYAKLKQHIEGEFVCVDSTGIRLNYDVEPSSTCNGKSFECPRTAL